MQIEEVFAREDWKNLAMMASRIFLILLLFFLAMMPVRRLLQHLEKWLIKKSAIGEDPPSESEKRIETLIRLLKRAAYIFLGLTALLIILKEFGVEIAPILASAGIVGLAVGFGAQNLIRDVISGFFIIIENQIRVGDVAIVNGTGGLVEKINFRTIVLRDLGGVVHVFPNGVVTSLSNLTNQWSAYVFDLNVAYKENTDRVVTLLSAVGQSMLADEKFGKLMLEAPEIFGIDRFDDSAVVIKGRIRTKPIRQWEVGREFLRRVKLSFDAQGIEVPYPQRTIHFGDQDKRFDPK